MSASILLVDDHEHNLATLEATLSTGDYELHTASDGFAACEAAERLRPDLVLLDVMMPDMDGFEVCRRIRATPGIESVPVVMITALNDRESRITGIAAGADDFIAKPFSIEELRVRVRTITRLNRARVIGEQRARFERLFALSPAAVLVVRFDGVIASANDRGRALVGRDPAGAEIAIDAAFPSAAEELIQFVAALLAGSACPTPADLRLRLPAAAGTRTWKVAGALLDERPAPFVLLSFEDITAEATAREDAEALSQRLDSLVRERTARLEEANQLLMSYAVFVAHDLRSPLSAVKGYLSIVAGDEKRLPPDALHCVRQAAAASRMIEEMITDTLALAKDEHAAHRPARPIDPRPVIERLCGKLVSLVVQQRPRITVHPLPLVLATGPLLDRIFFNLVSNALKYSATRPAPEIEIGATDTPRGVALYVRDNGVGFPPEEAESLFAEFSRLSTSAGHEGLGLGLSLVARLVRAHRGDIWAESRPGEGATFFVQLPAAPTSISATP